MTLKDRTVVLVVASLGIFVATMPACSDGVVSAADAGVDASGATPPGSASAASDAALPKAPDGPEDNPALYGRPSTCSADAGLPTADGGARCYDEAFVVTLRAKAPVKGQNVCSDSALELLRVACLDAGASEGGCKSATDANQDCARCVLGPLAGDSAASLKAPALLSTGDGKVKVNVAACAAIVAGRPDCALPLSKQLTCTSSACGGCAGADASACEAEAACGVCANVAYSPACTAAVADASVWEATCRGKSFVETYGKVAKFFCGAP